MYPETKKLAKLINELESVQNRLKNLLPKLATHEFNSLAMQAGQTIAEADAKKAQADDLFPFT